MRAATIFLAVLPAALAAAGCGGSGDGGNGSGPVDISGLDPSVETYTGSNSNFISENGFVLRILASAAPVHHGLVSVRFQDVETQEIRFPNDSHPTMIPLVVGATYVFHAWFHGLDVGGGATLNDVPIDLSAGFYSGSTFVSASPVTTVHLAAFGAWELRSFSFQVPQGVDRCSVSMRASAAPALNVDLFLDEFSIERTN